MKGTVLALLVICILLGSALSISFNKIYPRIEPLPLFEDTGDPLILTPFLKAGKIDEAKKLARVQNLSSVPSYSGYFTLNPTTNSNMFFWFFPASFDSQDAPVVVWLQGGPGGSSLFGLFVENGPFIVDANNNVHFRDTSWTLTHSVLYLDNPVGTGFSFTNDAGYVKSEEEVADGLYEALKQFYTMFPEYRKNEFYVTGESYAGKYVPAITYKIHMENQKANKTPINLRGMAIGDGFCDPINMLNYGGYLYNLGLLDSQELKFFQQAEEKARQYIKNEKFLEAFKEIDNLMDGDLTDYPSYFKNSTGFDFYFNYLVSSNPVQMDYYTKFVQLPHVRKALHVGATPFSNGSKVEENLREDMYQSVAPWISQILDAKEGYKVLIYSGQLDIIVASTLTRNFLHQLNWHGADLWKTADKKLWKVGNELAGYATVADNLTFVLVRNAGHMVPMDQPQWAFDMINRFTRGKPFA